ncbi:hypothetical protein [Actinacidiphila bryophytorum]|uniref:hypothetical protein n=1 Tax=Actinacidiphila bryophytorum TaxID=1436133 RepID=UPI002176DC40|nr:hypothetical protein [Actinacidiphila bryophytorum]UWE07959.1 hypothetical protein NYE86_03910 [Actinacidiphila bryophytorum]
MAVAAVLALSSCSSGGDDGEKKPTASSSASATGGQPTPSASTSAAPEPTGTATTPVESAGSGDATQTVEGVWLATQDTTKVQLVLGKGKAALTSTHLCGGGYTDRDGIVLTLTCMDGDTERTTGHGVMAADGKTLTVQWTGGTTDVFSRTGLPSN